MILCRFDGPSLDRSNRVQSAQIPKPAALTSQTVKSNPQVTPANQNARPKPSAQRVNPPPRKEGASSSSESDTSDDSDDTSDTSDDDEMTECVSSVIAMVQGVKHNLQGNKGISPKVTQPSVQPNKAEAHSKGKVTESKGKQNFAEKHGMKRKASESSESSSDSDSDSSDSSEDSKDESNHKKSVKSVSGNTSIGMRGKSAVNNVSKFTGSRDSPTLESTKVVTPLRNQPVDSQKTVLTPRSTPALNTPDTGPALTTTHTSTPANTNSQTPAGSDGKPNRKRKRTRKRNKNKGRFCHVILPCFLIMMNCIYMGKMSGNKISSLLITPIVCYETVQFLLYGIIINKI